MMADAQANLSLPLAHISEDTFYQVSGHMIQSKLYFCFRKVSHKCWYLDLD